MLDYSMEQFNDFETLYRTLKSQVRWKTKSFKM